MQIESLKYCQVNGQMLERHKEETLSLVYLLKKPDIEYPAAVKTTLIENDQISCISPAWFRIPAGCEFEMVRCSVTCIISPGCNGRSRLWYQGDLENIR